MTLAEFWPIAAAAKQTRPIGMPNRNSLRFGAGRCVCGTRLFELSKGRRTTSQVTQRTPAQLLYQITFCGRKVGRRNLGRPLEYRGESLPPDFWALRFRL